MSLEAPVLLHDAHHLEDFISGETLLDDWLRRRAQANHFGGATRTYVITDGPHRVVGYYALAAGALDRILAPGSLRQNMPDPVVVLGRLAVDTTCQGHGLSIALLQDAVCRARAAASVIGIRGIVVHAISDRASAFYQKFGFIPAPENSRLLAIGLGEG